MTLGAFMLIDGVVIVGKLMWLDDNHICGHGPVVSWAQAISTIA